MDRISQVGVTRPAIPTPKAPPQPPAEKAPADPQDLLSFSLSRAPAAAPNGAPAPVVSQATIQEVSAEPDKTRENVPLTFVEAQQYSQLLQDSPAEAREMLQTLHLLHPDAAWLASKIRSSITQPEQYDYLLRPWKELGEARRVAEEIAKGRQLLKLEGHGINAQEAQAIFVLGREQPIECEVLAADLGKRGEKAGWMVEQARKGDPYDCPINQAFVQKLSERWTSRVSAFRLMDQLQKTPAGPEPALTFGEARSVHFLGRESPDDAEKLVGLLARRNPSDGWLAGKILQSRQHEFTTQEFHHLQNRASAREQAYHLLKVLEATPQQPAEWNLSEAELKACECLDRDDPVAAKSLQEVLSQRGPSTTWALQRGIYYPAEQLQQEWQTVSAARQVLQGDKEGPLLASEAEAVRDLAELSPDEAKAFLAGLEKRGPGPSWVCRQVIRGAHMVPPPTLEQLEQRWQRLQEADAVLGPLDPTGPPLNWAEAQALKAWRAEYDADNAEKSKQLMGALKERNPDAALLCQRVLDAQEFTPEVHAGFLQDYEQLCQARLALQESKQDRLSLGEANALLTIERTGSQTEYQAARDKLTLRGPSTLLAVSLLKQSARVDEEEFAAIQTQVDGKSSSLRLLQQLTSTPQSPVPEGQMPFTTEEVAALADLQESSWALAHSMRQALGQRSDFAKVLPGKPEDFRGELPDQLQKLHDCWLLNRSYARIKADPQESAEIRNRYFHLGDYQLQQPLGLTSATQADQFVRTWQRLSDRSDPALVLALSQMEGIAQVPASTLESLKAHVLAGGTLPPGSSAEDLRLATLGWQVQAGMAFEKAVELGKLPLAERLNGQPGPFNKSELVLGLPPEKLPLAIEMMQGKSLNPTQRLALYSGLRQSTEANKALLNLKGAAFKEALQALLPLQEQLPDGELSPLDYQTRSRSGWEERGATALALTFRGSWRQWLDAQARIKGEDGEPVRSVHDVVDILPLRSLPGLDSFLLKNSHQKLPELSQVIGRWEELSEVERSQPFDEVLALARSKIYPHMVSPEFGAEAVKWGISQQDYPDLEARFLASQTVPSPFAHLAEKSWKSGDLSGRFLPREDVRGLFLGHHTNCCQHPTGAGATCAYHGQESPRGGFFVLENSKGQIVVQSWAWVSDQAGLVFDNVEGMAARSQAADVRAIYQAAADELVGQFEQVTMGLDHGKLPIQGWAPTTAQTIRDFDGYSDAERQVLLKARSAAL